MIALPPGVRVYLACGVTDMRKGMVGLAMLVQQGLAEDPFSDWTAKTSTADRALPLSG
jgi:transposase